MPRCDDRPSDCEDVAVINTLDGVNVQPRLSIPSMGRSMCSQSRATWYFSSNCRAFMRMRAATRNRRQKKAAIRSYGTRRRTRRLRTEVCAGNGCHVHIGSQRTDYRRCSALTPADRDAARQTPEVRCLRQSFARRSSRARESDGRSPRCAGPRPARPAKPSSCRALPAADTRGARVRRTRGRPWLSVR